MKELSLNESHLHEIEHLLAQSMNGIHLLFDNRTIARVLKQQTDDSDLFTSDKVDRIQVLFADFIQKGTFEEKKLFLSSLDQESFELLLRTYFHIVENSLYTADAVRH